MIDDRQKATNSEMPARLPFFSLAAGYRRAKLASSHKRSGKGGESMPVDLVQ
jgi:hypothetical protein